MVSRMVHSLQKFKWSMSLKLHLMDSHVEYFPENLKDYSGKQAVRFHQGIKIMEQRYQRRWEKNITADYCWMLKRDAL